MNVFLTTRISKLMEKAAYAFIKKKKKKTEKEGWGNKDGLPVGTQSCTTTLERL